MNRLVLVIFLVLIMVLPAHALQKNVASQVICAQLISLADGSAVTSGTTTVYVLGDGGTQGSGGGVVTHEGVGTWCYAPTQAETNYTHIAYTFVNTSAVTAMAQTYTKGYSEVAAYVPANVTYWNGSAVGATQQAGFPTVTIKDGTGTGEIDTLSGSIVNVDLVDLTTTTTTATTATTCSTCTALGNDAVSAAALKADAVDEILDEVIEGTYTLRQILKLQSSALFGVTDVTGSGPWTINYWDIVTGITTARIIGVTNSDGERTSVTLNPN